MTVLQVHAQTRPIQENKITCPACKEQTRIALMHTAYGSTFQAYLRDFKNKGKIPLYEPHLTPYGKSRPTKSDAKAKRKGAQPTSDHG
ncbi:hypothetical protein J8I26_17100 [Herbaspirillum sp. LeCh32-8]|uniref:hypothetical protein n=1 Tax=Herbaspirillum sp. LeCh32-8 TaxID=2821356 RepID=UPI001AE875D2|nr:hypothetical protein [Herbaspirillum sp. LeCh32-8]MBP0599831.1 hypothetical protein [Herbaspirillum sp. LeCh32-8]